MVNVQGTVPAPLNYAPPGHRPYPEVDLHLGEPPGLPRRPRRQDAASAGDIVNIDITVIKDGWHGDTSRMFYVGEPVDPGQAPVRDHVGSHVARHRAGAPGRHARRHRRARSRSTPRAKGYSVVREFCGHGIGKRFHEEPQILHYGRPGTGRGAEGRHDLHRRADDQRRQARHQAAERRLDHRHRATTASRRSGSTRCVVTADGVEVLTLSKHAPPPPAFIAERVAIPA